MPKIETYSVVTPTDNDTTIGTRALDGVTVNFRIGDIADIRKDTNYRHVQMIPVAVWTVTHNLNKYPAVMVVDTSMRVVIGEIDYIDLNTVKITFSAAMGGEAYFN